MFLLFISYLTLLTLLYCSFWFSSIVFHSIPFLFLFFTFLLFISSLLHFFSRPSSFDLFFTPLCSFTLCFLLFECSEHLWYPYIVSRLHIVCNCNSTIINFYSFFSYYSKSLSNVNCIKRRIHLLFEKSVKLFQNMCKLMFLYNWHKEAIWNSKRRMNKN